MDQVNHRMPWDIKREEPWESTIGTTYPGEHNTQIVFQGRVVTPEMLGNITYGYLGSAASMSEFELIAGGDYAAGGIEGIFTGADSEEDKAAMLKEAADEDSDAVKQMVQEIVPTYTIKG